MLSLVPLSGPLMVVAGVGAVGAVAFRIARAATHDLPVDEYRIFFCENKPCAVRFAEELTAAAREIS